MRVERGGGPLLIAGFQIRVVASALAPFAIAMAVAFHGPFADQNQMIRFLKDVIMAGGLPQIVTFGDGAINIDNRSTKDRAAAAKVALAG